jgi:hypothetical protein
MDYERMKVVSCCDIMIVKIFLVAVEALFCEQEHF